MTTISTPVDHQEEGAALMLSQFQNNPDLMALLASWLGPLNDLEQTLLDWSEANGVTTATGDFLDTIGSWLGVERVHRLDEEYRQAILAEGLLEDMDGTCERILEGLRVICQSDQVTFHEKFPNTVYFQSGDGWNAGTYDQVKRITMASTHVRLLLDHNLDSMIMGEILEEDNGLITGEGEQYVVVIEGEEFNLVTSITDSVLTDSLGDPLAELIDDTWTPMAEIMIESLSLVEGNVVEATSGNQLVDDLGNNVIYRDFN